MSDLTPTQVEVHLFRRRAGRVQFLCLRRAPGSRLPGVWQPVTGTLRRGERAVQGAAREVREETGLAPRRWWALESVSVWFDARSNRVHALPLFAAEVGPADRVALSGEHDAHRWLAARPAARGYLWEAQRRALEAVRREVLRGGALARALDVTELLDRSRGPARGRRGARALR
jgi:8-oxo-dGTP pyrophosphatase MutT (NUDIX family)